MTMLNSRQEDEKVIDEFKTSLLAEHEKDLDKIVFFGSRARGLGNPDSDYDVMLVINKKTPGLVDNIYEKSTDLSLKYGIDLSLKIYTAEEYKKKTEKLVPFFLNIKKSGVEIWNRQKKSL